VFSQGTGVVAGVLVIEVSAAASISASSCSVDHIYSLVLRILPPFGSLVSKRYTIVIIIIIIIIMMSIP